MSGGHDHILDEIIRREGGFVDHAADRGGPTKYGITQQTLSEHLKRPASVADVRNLTEATARAIYLQRYVVGPRFAEIEHAALRGLVVDCGVNHGPSRGARWLQLAVHVNPDGVLGPITLQAVNRADASKVYHRVLAYRIRFFGEIITNDPKQAVFAAGWMNRCAEFVLEAP